MINQITACQAIFSDIDGTLLTSDHKISELTRHKLQEAISKGAGLYPCFSQKPFLH